MTLRATFLGTAGAVPTTERNPSGIHVNRQGDEFLFDVGEGTQRQMMRYGTGFGVSHIFITHLHGDHVYGLPGLLETWDFNDRQAPLTVYAPERVRSAITALVTACGGEPAYPVHIRGIGPGDVAVRSDDYEVRAFATDHRSPSVGYALVEDERRGRFDRAAAEELGVPVGPKFSTLHSGEAVELEDGTVVEPEQVVGPPRPGRTFVYTGDTRPADSVITAAEGADLLVHDGTFGDDWADRADETGHSTARQAGWIAARAEVRRLVLTHLSSRYSGDTTPLQQQARETYDGRVTIAQDGLEIEIPFPD